MTPLGAVTGGLLLVLLDLRIGGLDLLPDVLGWVVAVGGLARLRRLDRGFGRVRAWALPTLVLSLADLVHPEVTTTTPDDGFGTTSTTATVAPEGLQGLLVTAYGLAMTVTVVLLCLALRDRARRHADLPLAERFSLFAFLHAVSGGLVLAGALVAQASGQAEVTPQGGAAALLLVLVVAALALEVLFLVTLSGARTRPWLQDPAPAVEDPTPLP